MNPVTPPEPVPATIPIPLGQAPDLQADASSRGRRQPEGFVRALTRRDKLTVALIAGSVALPAVLAALYVHAAEGGLP